MLHHCDALTCRHQETTEDSVICVITGCHLGRLYGSEDWNDRGVSSSLISQASRQTSVDAEVHVHDLILSVTAASDLGLQVV